MSPNFQNHEKMEKLSTLPPSEKDSSQSTQIPTPSLFAKIVENTPPCLLPKRFTLSGDPTTSFHNELLDEATKTSRYSGDRERFFKENNSCQHLRELISSGFYSFEDLTRQSIALAKIVNRHTNFLVDGRFEEAINEAKEWDRQTKDDVNGFKSNSLPFAGIPLLVKESFATKNMLYTYGLSNAATRKAEKDGPLVKRLRKLGFNIIGVTNVSESCMWAETYNPVFGRTLNPLDLALTPGGSSGGSACGVAGFVSPVAVTADVGGSTRIPAFACGLFGHKPSGGMLVNTGTHHDVCLKSICRICQPGLVCRDVRDLMRLVFYLGMPGSVESLAGGNLKGVEVNKECVISREDDPRNYDQYVGVGRKCNPNWAEVVDNNTRSSNEQRRKHFLKRIFVLMPTWEKRDSKGRLRTSSSSHQVPPTKYREILETRVVSSWPNYLIRALLSKTPVALQEKINKVIEKISFNNENEGAGKAQPIDISSSVYLDLFTKKDSSSQEITSSATGDLEIIPVSMSELECDWWFLLWAARLGHNEEKAFACKIGLIDSKWDYHKKCNGGGSFLDSIKISITVFVLFYFAFIQWLFGFSKKHTFPALILAIFDWYLVSESQNAYLDSRAKLLRKKFEKLFAVEEVAVSGDGNVKVVEEHHSVLIMPTLPWTTPPYHDEMLPMFLNCSYTAVWNALEFPATTVPICEEYSEKQVDRTGRSSKAGDIDGETALRQRRCNTNDQKEKSVSEDATNSSAKKNRVLPSSMQIVGLRDEITLSVALHLNEKCSMVRSANIFENVS